MRRLSIPAVAAVLVVVAATAGAAPAASQPSSLQQATSGVGSVRIVDAVNTTGYLVIPANESTAREYTRTGIDVGAAVATGGMRLGADLSERTFYRRFRSRTDADGRAAALSSLVGRIEARTASLQHRQQRAIGQYSDDQLSTTEFVDRLARIDAEARRLHALVDPETGVVAETEFNPPSDLQTRIANVRATLLVLQGPVRQRAGRTFAGAAEPAQVYVETSARGVVLTSVHDDRYVREAYLGSRRNPGGIDRFADSRYRISAAYERAVELYPWAFENAPSARGAVGFGDTAVYRVEVDHSQGTLVSYIDGNTTDAFREIQHKRLPIVPLSNRTTASDGSLSVAVETSHPTGPMRVTVTEAASDEPVAATVSAGDRVLGRTGSDGQLWLIQPGGTVELDVTAGERSVSTNVTA